MSYAALNDRPAPFEHLAMFYEGADGFSDQVIPFIEEGLRAGETALVAVEPSKIDLLRGHFGARDVLRYEDIRDIGRNPARIIPLWTSFVEESRARGGGFRGVGEPIWRGRSPDELVECARHEALLNVAFTDGSPWVLACPYDRGSLDASSLAEARRNHPLLSEDGAVENSATYRGTADIARPFTAPLEQAPSEAEAIAFTVEDLATVRRHVAGFAAESDLTDERIGDLVLAADEVAANSVRHGGGHGLLRCWSDAANVVCEVRDDGAFTNIMAGRELPVADQGSGYGLWLANQLCDLVQIRAFDAGSVVRIHLYV